jgi:TPR repeat protein
LNDFVELGFCYFYGIRGVSRNYQKAYEIFKKIDINYELPVIKSFLGLMNLEGLGVEKVIF